MTNFFDKFPTIAYDIEGKQLSNYQEVTNIFFRLGIIQSILSNISAYYEHTIADDETPEILAERVYEDPEAHWLILLANNIVDAQYDWPLNSRQFQAYIDNKYGSVANAKTQIHHYEKVITREESFSGVTTETRFVVNQTKLTNNDLDVPFDYYEGTGSLPETQSVSTHDLGEGRTVIEIVKREAISFYDYENALNDEKRSIKIIKPEFYGQIIEEFNDMTGNRKTPYLRKLT